MSEVLVGTAYWLAQLRYQQLVDGASIVEQQIKRLQALSKQPITFGAGIGAGAASSPAQTPASTRGPSPASQAADFDRLQRAQAGLEAQQARLARTQGDTARAAQLEAQAEERLNTVLAAQNGTTVQSIAIERQLASVQQQAARASQSQSIGAQAADQFKSSLIGIIGPAALVTTGIGLATRAVQSFGEAFKFKADLDTATRSIEVQLNGIRSSARAFDEARQFADRYKLTQEEVTTAVRESLPVLRQSSATTAQTLSVLSRLRIRNPLEDVAGAARAVAELQAGQILSLVNRFNLPRAEVNKLKAEIEAGGDAILVIDRYLNKLGLTEATLAAQTQGATGALRDQARAQEALKLAQGELATSQAGIAFVDLQTRAYVGLTRVLGGAGGLGEAFRQLDAQAAGNRAGQEAYNQAIAAGKTETEAMALAQRAAAQAASDFAYGQSATTKATYDQVAAFDEDRIAIGRLQIAAENARVAVSALTLGAAPSRLPHLNDPNVGLIGGTIGLLAKGQQAAAAAASQSNAEFDRLAALQLQNRLIHARTAAQRIAILQEQLAKTTDAIERQSLQNQIDQEKYGGKGRVDRAATTALQLNQVEENSGLQLLKTQRENNERLRDQQQDFDLKRTRSQEDEDRKIRRLLASGQRAAAAREREEFAIQQRRDREDFDIQRRRTLRNNAESTGDIGARTDLRQQQIQDRAALRGVRVSGQRTPSGVDLGEAPPTLAGGRGGAGAGGAFTLKVQISPTSVQIDGHQIVELTWPEFEQRVDTEMADELGTIGIVLPPGSGQTAVAGVTP